MGIMLLLCLQTVLYLPQICQMQCLWRIPIFLTSNLLKDYISLKSSNMDCLELNLCTCKYKSTLKYQIGVFSWASLGHKSLSRQLRISHKYDKEFMRASSMQPASSPNLLKKVSSVVKRSVWDSPILDVEFGTSDKVR